MLGVGYRKYRPIFELPGFPTTQSTEKNRIPLTDCCFLPPQATALPTAILSGNSQPQLGDPMKYPFPPARATQELQTCSVTQAKSSDGLSGVELGWYGAQLRAHS